MSIKAYVGRMGSGKTYEVVSVVILGALARGRRVVSNIAGLDFEAMRSALVQEGVSEERIGQLVQIEHVKVLEPTFWRTDKDAGQGVDAFLQGGDLLALDEIWRFWEGFSDKKMPDRVMNFFRMHRHFTHPETGIACDVALITQDVMDIARRVRAVIEETYYMEKLTAIGSTKRYRVDVHQGGKTSRRPLRAIQRSYDPKYFGFYKSHSQAEEGGAGPREENIDQRGNILRGALFRVVLPLGLVVIAGAFWFLWKFFHPVEAKPVQEQAKAERKPSGSHAKPDQTDVSQEWRVVGYVESGGSASLLVTDGQALRLLQNPPAVKVHSIGVESFLPGGEAVTSWSGRRRLGIIEQAAGEK